MIFDSGYIQIKTTVGGGLVDGIPTQAIESLGELIPCHIQKITENNKGKYEDGKFIQFAFNIFIEMQDFEAKRVQLTNNRNQLIGEFEVQSIEFLDLVQRVKIIV